MEYNYSDNTLMHSIGFNLQRFVSILNNGILSKNMAIKNNINFSKNYLIEGLNDDYVSMLRVGSINLEEEVSAYKIHTTYGISFIVEDTQFESDKDKYFIHRIDEVLVKDMVSLDKIKGIAIPNTYKNVFFYDLCIIPPDITSYKQIVNVTKDYIDFLNSLNYQVDKEEIKDYLSELYYTHMALHKIKDDDSEVLEKEELINNHKELLSELNEILGEYTHNCFEKILGYEGTLYDIVSYLTNGLYNIYDIPFDELGRGNNL